jgi:hypothetical protein
MISSNTNKTTNNTREYDSDRSTTYMVTPHFTINESFLALLFQHLSFSMFIFKVMSL